MTFWVSILAFIACLAAGAVLARTRYFAYLQQRPARYDTLDGLRGFLAIAVLCHHFCITWYWKQNLGWERPPEIYYQNCGKIGVALFFMITGFLFIARLLNSGGRIEWLRLFESRVFRIVPLYMFALLVISLVVFYQSGGHLVSDMPTLLKEYVRWLVFQGGTLNSYADTRLVIAGVDWTLRYEWLFYLSLPLVAVLLFRLRGIGVALLVALVGVSYLWPTELINIETQYFVLFLVGGMGAWLYPRTASLRPMIASNAASSLVVLLLVAILLYPHTLDSWHLLMVSTCFLMLACGNPLFGLLMRPGAKVLGEISYSLYLLHGLVLYGLFTLPAVSITGMPINVFAWWLPLVAVLVVGVSAVSFLLIEKPWMQYGRRSPFTMQLQRVQTWWTARTQ